MHANFLEMVTSFCETKIPALPGGEPTWAPSPAVMEVDGQASKLHPAHPDPLLEAYQKFKEEVRVATGVVHRSMTGIGFESPPRLASPNSFA